MDQPNVTLEQRGDVGLVTLRRPQRRNALDQATWDALEARLEALHQDPPRVVLFTGEGRAFCAGFDVRPDNPITAAFFEGMQQQDGDAVAGILTRLKGVLDRIESLPVPTIAAINGDAHGGGVELALCCDLRVMDAEAVACMAEARIGLMPDLGGTARLLRLLGRARALDMIWTSRDVRADEALSLGLINRVAPAGHAVDSAMDLAALMIQNGPAALRAIKRVARAMDQLEPALEAETAAAVECILSGEAIEGITAFMHKRPPKW